MHSEIRIRKCINTRQFLNSSFFLLIFLIVASVLLHVDFFPQKLRYSEI